MQERNSPVKKPKIQAQKKHVILLIISCVILVASMIGMIVFLSSDPEPPAAGDEQSLGYLFVALASILTKVFTIILVILLCGFAWGVGLLLSAGLAFHKQDKPRWLWICSVILTSIFALLVLAVLIYLGSIACTMLRFYK